jgi:photosystem II stability/assembly factor-like uncharacterized protein
VPLHLVDGEAFYLGAFDHWTGICDMTQQSRILSLLFVTLLIPLRLHSQAPLWEQTNGPLGGRVATFCFDGNRTYAGGKGGVFASDDGGKHWIRVGPDDISVTTIAALGGYIFVGTEGNGIYRSKDRGTTWTSLRGGLPAYYSVSGMATVNGILFAANHDPGYFGIYRSTDLGKTWNQSTAGIDNRAIKRVFVTDSALIASAAGSQGSGMFRSTDYGLSWTRIDQNQFAWNAECITKFGSVIYGADFENSARVLRSSDDGRTWGRAIAGPDDMITALYADANGLIAGTYGHGLYIYREGAAWYNIGSGLPDQTFYPIAGTGSSVFISSADGVFASASSTSVPFSWSSRNVGLINSDVTCLTWQGGVVFAGTDGGGLYGTSDNGVTWKRIDVAKNGFIIDAVSLNGWLFVVATSNYHKDAGSLLVSTDGGSTWTSRSVGVSVRSLYASQGVLFAAAGYDGLYSSTDLGNSWRSLPCASATSVATLGPIIVAAAGYGPVYRSTDNGSSWGQITIDPHGSPPFGRVATVSGVMYAGCEQVNDVYMSVDSGATWQLLEDVPLGNCDVEAFCGDGDAVYAALSRSGGVIGSMDRGQSWSRYDFNLSRLDVRALTSANGYLFAGTAGGGVFRLRTTAGLYVPPVEYLPQEGAPGMPTEVAFRWAPSEGARSYRLQVANDPLFLDVFAEDSSILATSTAVKGLRHNSTYYWKLRGVNDYGSWGLINSWFTTEIGPFGLSQNYPNPFNGRTTIEFSLAVTMHVTIEVYNLLGQRVCALVSSDYGPGDHTTTWEPRGLSSGIYFCRIIAGNLAMTRKMLYIR